VAQINGQVVFAGRGRGHGIGLCQAGCARMGEEGKSYREILQFAYPGNKLGLSAAGFAWQYTGGERVDVFTTTPDALLVAATDNALREAEQASGLTYRNRPRLRVYPNLSAYRNATGESGAIAATTRGFTIRMQPPEMLRARHVLEATLRHEMLHVVLESVAARDQPWWFREGLVLAVNNERPADPRYRAAVERVNALLARFGRETVFNYWRTGLPPDAQVEPRRVQQQPSPAPPKQKASTLQRKP
jgi:stage II sporulation protein D